MWVSKNHPDYERLTRPLDTAPVEQGQRLAAIPRNRGDEELRIDLSEFNGRPYVSLRVWGKDQQGQWWPVKGKGLSVRLHEIEETIFALERARATVEQGSPPDDSPSPPADPGRPQYVERRRRPPAREYRPEAPAAQGGGLPFDEFSR